jgi:hypothetical protein
MADYERPPRLPFLSAGVDLASPPDMLRQNKYLTLINVTTVTEGVLEPRSALVNNYAASGNRTPTHSLRRLNDTSTGTATWARVYGIADRLQIEKSSAPGALVDLDGPYSSSPFTLIRYRPPRSPQPWMYVGDTTRARKVKVDGTVHQVGLARPPDEPTAFVDSAWFKTIDLFDSAAGWAATGTNPPTSITAVVRVNTAASGTNYKQEFSGIGSIGLVPLLSMVDITPGTVLSTVVAGPGFEDVYVSEVRRASTTVVIDTIVYDSGTTGLCTVALRTGVREIAANAIILLTGTISGGSEYCRVRSTTTAADGSVSIRLRTTGARVSGDSVAAKAAVLLHSIGVLANGAPYTSSALKVDVAAGSGSITRTLAIDLTNLQDASGSSPANASTLDDVMSICIRVDTPANVTEMQLQLDCYDGTFTNYYYRPITPDDLTPLVAGTQTALDNRQTQIERSQLNPNDPSVVRQRQSERPQRNRPFEAAVRDPFDGPPGDAGGDPRGGHVSTPGDVPSAPRDQFDAGSIQWTNVTFRLREMQRIGTQPKGLKDIGMLRVVWTTTAPVTVYLDSWVLAGGFEPDSVTAPEGYEYRVRARCASTGVVSDWSPATRAEVDPRRQRVYLTWAAYAGAAEADTWDFERRGGFVAEWAYIGSKPMSGGTQEYYDFTSDSFAAAGIEQDTDESPNIQPWVTLLPPLTRTASTVAGTAIKLTATVDSRMVPGTALKVGGTPTTLYRAIDDGAGTNTASVLEAVDGLGDQSSVAVEINQPFAASQPLLTFGPFQEYVFGFGDVRNPATLYYSKKGQPDAHSAKRYVEVCDPAETIMNGFTFNSRAGLFTDRRQFIITYDPTNSFGQIFAADEVANSKGLHSRYAMAVSERGIAFLAAGGDGIYLTQAGAAENLTRDDLAPLFPVGEKPGVDTNGISAPNLNVATEEPYLRLWFGLDGSLYFSYRDVSLNSRCIRYDFAVKRWYPIVFSKPTVVGYVEEGKGLTSVLVGGADATQAHVYTLGGSADNGTDAGTTFPCTVHTGYKDFDDPRARKQFGDYDIDLDCGGATVTVTPMFDNGAVIGTPSVFSGTGRVAHTVDLVAGNGQFAKNMGLQLTWTGAATQRPKLYLWQPSFIRYPEDTFRRATDWDFVGVYGMKYFQGIRVEVDTGGATRTIQVQYNDGTGIQNGPTLSVNSNGRAVIVFPSAAAAFLPFRAHQVRLIGGDDITWNYLSWDWVFNPEPETTTSYFETQETNFDYPGYGHIRECYIAYRSTAVVTMQIVTDRGSIAGIPTLPSTGGAYVRQRILVPAWKQKWQKFILSAATGFSLYEKDSSVMWKPYGSNGEYQEKRPFGEVSRENGARV